MSRNDITGDEQRTKGIMSEKARENYDRIFPPKKIERGSFKWDKETGKLIPKSEWNAKYNSEPKERGPLICVKGFDAFPSPTSGKVISNYHELNEDMKRSGCRTYEGLEQEQKEVDRFLAYEDKELEECISESVDETYYQIEHNYSRPEAPSHVNFSLGDEE